MPLPRQPSTKRGRNASIASSLRLRLIARRSPSASPTLNPAAAIDTSSTWSWKTTTPSVSRERLAQRLVLDRRRRSSGPRAGGGGSRCTGGRPCPGSAPGGRARPARSGRRGSRAACAAGSASARGSRSGRRRRCRRPGSRRRRPGRRAGSRERSIGSPCRRAIVVDGLLDGGEHPEPEQVDLEEAGVGARVLVPLADLPAGHRGGLTGTRSISGRDETIIPPGCCEMWRGRPAISRVSSRNASQRGPACAPGTRASSSPTRVGVPAVGDAREPLELAERQAERLADVADRAAAAVGGEARDERGMLAAVALGDARRSASRGSRAGSRGRCRGRATISSLRKRPSERFASTGSTCERPVR